MKRTARRKACLGLLVLGCGAEASSGAGDAALEGGASGGRAATGGAAAFDTGGSASGPDAWADAAGGGTGARLDGGPDASPQSSLDASADALLDATGLDGGTEGGGGSSSFDAGPITVTFVDVAVEAGIDHVQATNWMCETSGGAGCDPESARMTGGAAAGDYDGDGHVDLFVTLFNAPDRLYRNLGDGTFVEVASTAGVDTVLRSNGAGFCDVDNDGDQDLYVTALGDTRHYLFVNDGAGSFEEQAVSRGAGVEPAELHQGTSVSFGDYDRDGFADLHVNEWRPWGFGPVLSMARLLRNRGAAAPGWFDDVTLGAGVSLEDTSALGVFSFASSFSDLDDDGLVDLVVAADFGSSRLFWNNGDGTFTDGTGTAGVGTDENGMGSTIGDYDGDGRLDWFVTAVYDPAQTCETQVCNWGYSGNRLYKNEGGRVFSDQTTAMGVRDGAWGWGTSFFDYDNDGDLDLVMTNGIDFSMSEADQDFVATPMRLWRNDDGVMHEVAVPSGLVEKDSGKGLLVLDYDEDGDLDIFVANHGQAPRLYRNDGGNAKDWLRVRLVGTRSTRDALGARVWVKKAPDAAPMLREVTFGSNFLGQNEPTLHFGLGGSDSADDAGDAGDAVSEVRVRWPTGEEQVLTGVARNQTLAIVEPAGG